MLGVVEGLRTFFETDFALGAAFAFDFACGFFEAGFAFGAFFVTVFAFADDFFDTGFFDFAMIFSF
jgi:hypothetical protein